MLIRPLSQNDLDALRSLWRITWRDTYGAELGPRAALVIDASVDGDAIQSMFTPDGGCLVAIEDGEILGSVCFVERGPVAYVWGMYVRPSHQRAGIGTRLLRRAASTFQNAEWVDCSAVDARALAFYRKLGFADQGPGEVELFQGVRRPTIRLVIAARDLCDPARPQP